MAQGLSREEFYRWAEAQPRRYERVAGQPVAMSPERAAHVQIKYQIWVALTRAIQIAGLDCQVIGDGITVEVDEDTDYEPDAVINCGAPVNPDTIAAPNPVVVVEVLSPSTQSIDTSEKLTGYFRVPSIEHYLVVGVRRREVIHYQRAKDEIASRVVNLGTIQLDPPGIAVDINEFYQEPRFAA